MKCKVLHVLRSMNRGGAETFIMNVFRNVRHGNFQFDFLLSSQKNDYAREILDLGGTIYNIQGREKGLLNYCRELNHFFLQHKGEYHVVHVHTSSLSSLEPLYYARKSGIPIRIIHSHSTNQTGLIHKTLHYLNKPFVPVLATNYLACSQVALDWLYDYTTVKKRAIVIRNGIDTARFKFNALIRRQIREELGIEEDVFVFGHVGRFCEVKNHRFLVEVFEKYLRKYGHAKLVLVGGGELFAQTQEMVKKLELDGHVLFLGVRSDIECLLQAMDVFVFPSLYEGLPVALVEAQASGVKVVCSDKVSKESKLSDGCYFYSLANGATQWADYIHGLPEINRDKMLEQVKNNRYDIKDTVSYLCDNIYMNEK